MAEEAKSIKGYLYELQKEKLELELKSLESKALQDHQFSQRLLVI